MKNTLLAGMLLAATSLMAQAPDITWTKSYGTSHNQFITTMDAALDGGYIFGGFESNPDFSGLYLIMKTDANGDLEWETSYGGSYGASANDIRALPDGGYLITGSSNSLGEGGGMDIWTLKLDSNGQIVQEISLEGVDSDETYAIALTNDGGFILTGHTASTDIFPDIEGSFDALVMKYNNQGNVEWQNTYGGTFSDRGNNIMACADGSFIVAGTTDSTDGDITTNHGNYDIWVFKISAQGELLWQKTYGGSLYEETYTAIATPDGGCIVGGSTTSYDGDVSGHHGASDMWVIKIDSSGNLEWQNTLGGSSFEAATGIILDTDGGYLVAGVTSSSNGDITEQKGLGDGWLVKLTAEGTLEWQKTFGGTGGDAFHTLLHAADGGIVLAGQSTSNDYDVPSNNGASDVWMLKLGGELVAGLNSNVMAAVSAYPNPTRDLLNFSETLQTIKVFTADGKEVLAAYDVQNINISHLSTGFYFAEMETVGNKQRIIFVKE